MDEKDRQAPPGQGAGPPREPVQGAAANGAPAPGPASGQPAPPWPPGQPPPAGWGYPWPPNWGYPYGPPQAPPPSPARKKAARRNATLSLVFGCVATAAGFIYIFLLEYGARIQDFFSSYLVFFLMCGMLALAVTGLVLSILSRKDLPEAARGIATAGMVLCIVALPVTFVSMSLSSCIMFLDVTCGSARGCSG